jgi:hypothetical protein
MKEYKNRKKLGNNVKENLEENEVIENRQFLSNNNVGEQVSGTGPISIVHIVYDNQDMWYGSL